MIWIQGFKPTVHPKKVAEVELETAMAALRRTATREEARNARRKARKAKRKNKAGA